MRVRFETRELLFAVLCLCVLVRGQCVANVAASDLRHNPRVEFETMICDFGFARQNQKVKHRFVFSNTGSKPLVIEAVRSSCGCLASLVPSNRFSPGAKGAIEVTCETGRRIGQLSESVYVESNDPQEPEITLKITGHIRVDFALDPESLHIGSVERGAPVLRVLKLVDLSDHTLDLKRVEVPSRYFAVDVQRFDDKPIRGFLIQIALKPDAPTGPFTLPLTLHTNLQRRPRIDVPVAGYVLGNIRVDPHTLSLGRQKRGETVEKRLTVWSFDGAPFRILQLASDPAVLTAEAQRVDRKSQFELALRISAKAPLGPFAATLTVHTNAPEQPLIPVHIRGMVTKPNGMIVASKTEEVPSPLENSGTLYITRIPLEEDTYVSAWLIKRFLDPNARFDFVSAESPIAEEEAEAVLFDLPDPRVRWRRTQRACAAEHVLAEIEESDSAVEMIVEYVRKLERASWLVSPNSNAGRLRAWILKINSEVSDPVERVLKVFQYLDEVRRAKGKVPE